MLVITALFVAATAPAADPVVFPGNAGYANIQTLYGAKGDGTTDDTAAFRKAVADNVRQLYLPHGVYLVSDSVVLGGKRWILQGESRDGTIIKLKDRAVGFEDPARPKPLLSTFGSFMDPKAAMGQAFRNSLFDLTIDVGSGNPGAIGLHYLNNNQGTIRNVTVRSSDPQKRGKAGIALVTNWPGPALFDFVRVEGFDVGIWSTISQYSIVLDRIELEGQREAGIENAGQTLTIRRLHSRNVVPAIRSKGPSAVVTLFDSELIGGNKSNTAIESTDGATLVAFRLKTAGYANAIRSHVIGDTQTVHGPNIESFVSHPPLPTSVKTPLVPLARIEDAPFASLPPIKEWADVTTFGAKPVTGKEAPDAGPAIQKAIDSGKSVVYFPHGTYAIRSTVQVRGKVQCFIGMESRIRGLTGTEPVWRIEDGDAPFVVFERMDGDYEATTTCYFEHASKRTLVLRQMMTRGYRNSVPGGTVFLDDVCGHDWQFRGQMVWARQLNPEAKDKLGFNIRAEDSQLWLLGVKTEGPKTVLSAKGGRTELWGGFFYASRGTEANAAAIHLTDGEFLGNWVNHLGGSYRPQVRHQRGDRIDEMWLHVDFSDLKLLPLRRKELRGDTILEEKQTNQNEKTADGVFRHGSYGVKVPLFSAPAVAK
ncbi:MAG: glycosyl hydrolase family 28-related protein [Gemmataceae bacterium]|nr:glycosyl hydrolase family 28-related protein [Gemmataceae bacterium]